MEVPSRKVHAVSSLHGGVTPLGLVKREGNDVSGTHACQCREPREGGRDLGELGELIEIYSLGVYRRIVRALGRENFAVPGLEVLGPHGHLVSVLRGVPENPLFLSSIDTPANDSSETQTKVMKDPKRKFRQEA